MNNNNGYFIISLDFELYWGLQDTISLTNYRDNLLKTWDVIPQLLELFKKYHIHATWAIVGFLFYNNSDELFKDLPEKKPCYKNKSLSAYNYLSTLNCNSETSNFHFAPALINKIISYDHQEIASHTFSHYYCLEEGQDHDTFSADLEAAFRAAQKFGQKITSLVFPRNQYNASYIQVCKNYGVTAYRGNESSWIFQPAQNGVALLCQRGLRFIDSYINLSGHLTYSIKDIGSDYPFNLASSRFLRPYKRFLKSLEPRRLKRILSCLDYAARMKRIFHVWFHPHNFGKNSQENMEFLEKILQHYHNLHNLYGLTSITMKELAQHLLEAHADGK